VGPGANGDAAGSADEETTPAPDASDVDVTLPDIGAVDATVTPTGETAALAAEEADAEGSAEPLPDNARQRAPWLVRLGIASAPLIGFLLFAIALIGFIAASSGQELPIVGPVTGEWPLGVLLLGIAVWAVWLLWQVPRWQAASWRRSMELKEREIFDIENSARSTLGQILSGVAVLAGLIFAWQQLGNTSQNLFVSQEGQITDRFSRAVGQLGDEDLTIRLGGIYALERIARDSERDHETVMEILAAFARGRAPIETEEGSPGPNATSEPALLTSLREIPLDVDVVLKVISRRDSSRDGAGCINLSGINLAGFRLGGSSLDLTNVCLRDADLRGAELVGVDFSGADLAGSDLTGANLDSANLAGAQLPNTHLVGANLSRANLTGANLTGANMERALLEGALLRDAILNGTNLSFAFLVGADLQGANLMGATLDGAVMAGASLQGASLTAEQAEAANLDPSQLSPGILGTPDD
jgi:uncharacterized protein YjbI with pentapeptide repeats